MSILGQEDRLQTMKKQETNGEIEEIENSTKNPVISARTYPSSSSTIDEVLTDLEAKKRDEETCVSINELNLELFKQLKASVTKMREKYEEYRVFYDEAKKVKFKQPKAFAAKMKEKYEEFGVLYDEVEQIKLKMKKGSHTVIHIDGKDETIAGDRRFHKKHAEQNHAVWATFFTSEIAIACSLEKLCKVESTGKLKEQSVVNFGEAFPEFGRYITFTAMFLLGMIYTAILTPRAFRVHANSMLLLLLLYYILALAEALSGCSVAWASTEVPALLFVCAGTIFPLLFMGSIIMGVKSYFKLGSL